MSDFVIKDSGKRDTFDGGMVRDTTEGKINWALTADGPMLRRWAIHLTEGAKKYAKRNWMLARGQEEYDRAKESAYRHFSQWFADERDEDHAAAVIFNINETEYILSKQNKSSKSIEWAAGIFEGEGSIVVRPSRNAIQLTLYSTDKDVVESFHAVVSVGSIKGPRIMKNTISSGEAKHMWEWHAYSSEAKEVLEKLKPFFCKRRQAKAEEALLINSRLKSGRK